MTDVGTYVYRCRDCGVEIKGRATGAGEIRATSLPLTSSEVREGVCIRCLEER